MKVYEGKLVSENIKIGIVAARFNEFIVSKLLSGCEDGLLRHGVKPEDISVAWVPGAFEIPAGALQDGRERQVRRGHRPRRGHPRQHQPLRLRVQRGLQGRGVRLAQERHPVMFGVLTTDSIEQAIERAGTKAGNKGAECAQGAIEMVNLLREIEA